ncbi:MAG: aldo/keto reductase [Bacteroidota bacterium]
MYKQPFVIGCMKLGAWGARYNKTELEQFIDGCLDLGLDEFDHADIYGGHTTEAEFGNVLATRSDLKNKVKITTKCGIAYPSENRPEITTKHYNLSKDYILESINQSLRNLKVDTIDTFLIHRPDFLMSFEEIAEAISEAKQAGKVIHFGVSNFQSHQLDILSKYVNVNTNQIEISLTHLDPFENGALNQMLDKKIQPTAWSPLGGGQIFNGKEERFERIRITMDELLEKYSASYDQLLLAFLRKHPAGIIPVLGTSKISRIKTALDSLSITLSHEDWYKLWTASKGEKVA